jgi:hypothetical protein
MSPCTDVGPSSPALARARLGPSVYFVSDQPVLFWPTLVVERPEAHTTLATPPAPAPFFYFNIYFFHFAKNIQPFQNFAKL